MYDYLEYWYMAALAIRTGLLSHLFQLDMMPFHFVTNQWGCAEPVKKYRQAVSTVATCTTSVVSSFQTPPEKKSVLAFPQHSWNFIKQKYRLVFLR